MLEADISSLTSDDALAALREQFDFDVDEFVEEEETAAAVFGSSLVNFPRKVKCWPQIIRIGAAWFIEDIKLECKRPEFAASDPRHCRIVYSCPGCVGKAPRFSLNRTDLIHGTVLASYS